MSEPEKIKATVPEASYDQPVTDDIDLSTLGKAAWLTAKIIVPILIGAVIVSVVIYRELSLTGAIVGSFVMFVLGAFIAIPLFLACAEDEIIEADQDH